MKVIAYTGSVPLSSTSQRHGSGSRPIQGETGYPPKAREHRVEGVVALNVIIDKQGNVTDIELISGHPLLAPASIAAVGEWKYKPYLLKGSLSRSKLMSWWTFL